jgi:hypothetical protein
MALEVRSTALRSRSLSAPNRSRNDVDALARVMIPFDWVNLGVTFGCLALIAPFYLRQCRRESRKPNIIEIIVLVITLPIIVGIISPVILAPFFLVSATHHATWLAIVGTVFALGLLLVTAWMLSPPRSHRPPHGPTARG